tara:strand:- start:156 stop:488 length:333 start_codon:yes stop_codon:yes gene_type:complete
MLTITNSASHELLRQSISRGSPGDIYLELQPDKSEKGWMFLRVKSWEGSGVPIARTDGLTVYVSESQKNLLDGLTVDHYQDLTGGGFLISTPLGAEKSNCGSGFKFIKKG